MTLRARPVARRPGRAGWDSGDRRTTLINAGFAGAIAISILILLGYAAWSWYDGHFGTAASVNGSVVTRDDVRTRLKIENFRIDYTEAQVDALVQSGKITEAVASQQKQFLAQRRQSIGTITLEKLIDVTLQGALAVEEGVTVSDADVDAQLLKEKTIDEERHVWLIEVEPGVDPTSGQVGDTQKAEARRKAEVALADLKAGKSWDDVAKTASTAASAPQAGDVGWMPKDSGYDEKLMDAVFALTQGSVTDVVPGADGTYRIGRATEIAPATVDGAFETKLEAAGIALADYRVAMRADVIRQKLSDKVVADLSKASLQRHVLQIKLESITPVPDGVKVRHILFAPKDDATNAANLPADDPAWQKAKDEADAAYATLQADPTKFDLLARTMSDEGSAKTTGGKQPFYDPSSAIDSEFAKAILAPGLKPGQILAPFKTAFGWHIVQFMRPYGDGNEAWLETIKQQADSGTSFSQLARDQGEGDEAAKGGDIGWVAVGQLGDAREGPIFAAKLGTTTNVIDIPDDGDYLFEVTAEATLPASADQIKVFEDTGFSNWYSLKKGDATITRATDSTAVTG
jgi:parvulin-like peptidyl-prolyl isomerase